MSEKIIYFFSSHEQLNEVFVLHFFGGDMSVEYGSLSKNIKKTRLLFSCSQDFCFPTNKIPSSEPQV